MHEALARHLLDCERDPAVRCVALTGAGTAFCSGGDIGGMGKSPSSGSGDEDPMAVVNERIRRLRHHQDGDVIRLHNMAKPTVALINGPAIGAGLSISLACDLRLMSDQARLSAGFAAWA